MVVVVVVVVVVVEQEMSGILRLMSASLDQRLV